MIYKMRADFNKRSYHLAINVNERRKLRLCASANYEIKKHWRSISLFL